MPTLHYEYLVPLWELAIVVGKQVTQLPNLKHQVDVRQISARLNRALHPQGVNVAVVYQANRLQVSLESLDVLDRSRMTRRVIQLVQELQVPIKTLEIRGYRSGESAALWQHIVRVKSGRWHTHSSNLEHPVRSQVSQRGQSIHLSEPQSQQSARPSTGAVSALKNDLLERGRQGELQAIRSIVRRALSDYAGLRHVEELTNGVLRVTVITQAYLGGPAFASEVAEKLEPIASERVRELEIYKRKFADSQPFLIQRIPLLPEPEHDSVDLNSVAQVRTAPIGVKLIALLYGLVGGVNAIVAIVIAGMLVMSAVAVENTPNVLVMFPYMASILLSTLAIASGAFVVAIGLWHRRRWSLLLSYLLAGLMLFRGGQMLLDIWGTSTFIINLEIGIMVLMGLMLFYLSRTRVTRQFN